MIVLVLVIASMSNSSKYYLKPAEGAVEIWQGSFAPMGKGLLLSIPGAEMPETVQPEYAKNDVFPLAFNYYISKADALAEIPGLPDFEGIKVYLNKALDYATTREAMKTANARLVTIEMLILVYKAEAFIGQETIESLETAREYLEEAAMLDLGQLPADPDRAEIKNG